MKGSRILTLLEKKFFQLKAKRIKNCIVRCKESNPVFILGVQKTGSTAISSLLSELTNSTSTIDILRSIKKPEWKVLYSVGLYSFEEYIYTYKKEFSKEIIKEPGLTFYYEELSRIFPRASFVMILRNPLDNIRSILNRLDIPGDLTRLNVDDYPKLKNSSAWKINMNSSYLGFHEKNYIATLARRWDLAAKIYLANSSQIKLIRYEDFKENKIKIIEDLAVYFDFEKVNDISGLVDKQYQKKGDFVSDYNLFYGEENLNIIREICLESAEKLGYKL